MVLLCLPVQHTSKLIQHAIHSFNYHHQEQILSVPSFSASRARHNEYTGIHSEETGASLNLINKNYDDVLNCSQSEVMVMS